MYSRGLNSLVSGILVIYSMSYFDKIKINDPVRGLLVQLVNKIFGTLAVTIWNLDFTLIIQIKGIFVIGSFTFI